MTTEEIKRKDSANYVTAKSEPIYLSLNQVEQLKT